MRDDQIDRLKALAEDIGEVFLEEADPNTWPGAGMPLDAMDKDQRGDRYWSKVCAKCNDEKPVTEFYKRKSRKSGITSRCKDCIKKEMSARYSENPEPQKARSLARYAADPEKIKEKNAAWRAANPEKCRAMGDAWHAANPDKVKASRDKFNASDRGKEAGRYHRMLRRARQTNAGGEVTRSDINELFRIQRGRCACCKTKLDSYHVDHIQPLSAGGSNDKSNIQILCVTCNLSKGAKDPIEFMQKRGFLL